jgi:titin
VNGDAQLAWRAPLHDGGAAITEYVVSFANGAQACETAALRCTVTGLSKGSSYTFSVVARNVEGTSPPSIPSDPMTAADVASAPLDISASANDGSITVSWLAPTSDGGTPILGYVANAYVGAKGVGLCSTVDSTTCTIDGLANGQTYWLTVVAVTELGDGALGDPVAAMPSGLATAPLGVAASRGDGRATIRWFPSADNGGSPITGYLVTAIPSGKTCETASALSCVITGLTNGGHYTFVVQAENRNGLSPVSAATGYLTPSTVPGAPTAVAAALGENRVTVTWAAPASNGGSPITNYVVVASPGERVCQTSGARSCQFTSLGVNTRYTFTVFATNRNGASPVSQPSAPIVTLAPPGVPQEVALRAGNAAVNVSWKAPLDGGGAVISAYTATLSPGGGSCVTSLLTCTISGLQNGVAYAATVVATNVAGDSVAGGSLQSVTPTGLPGVVAQPQVVRGDGNATVKWTQPLDPGGLALTGYIVTPTYNGVRQTGRTVPASTTTYLATSLPLGAAVTFTVTALNANGQGAPSQASQPIVAATVPSAPTVPVVTQTAPGQLNITWASIDNGGDPITSYQVTSTPAGHGCTTSQTGCVISGLVVGATFRFTVVAQNAIGSSPRSAVSLPTSVAIPTKTFASAVQLTPTRLFVATLDRQLTAYVRATGAVQKVVTLPCVASSLLADGTSLWVNCGSSRTVVLLDQNLATIRAISLPGPVVALSIGGPSLYVATSGLNRLTVVNRLSGQVSAVALSVVPTALSCTASGCTLLTSTGGTKLMTWSAATKKLTMQVALPSSVTEITAVGTSIVASSPTSPNVLRVDGASLRTVQLATGEGALAVDGAAGLVSIISAHRVTTINLVTWLKSTSVELPSPVRAAEFDGNVALIADALSPWIRVVVAA